MDGFFVEFDGSDQVILIQVFKEIGSIGTITERDVPFFHNTREWIVELIFTNEDGVEFRIEVFG